jgi:SAM-dependent methyltransferase
VSDAVCAEWFREAFGEDYLSIYGHRDDAEAERLMQWLAPRLDLAGACVLDLACGTARFSAPVRSAGATYVGLDLSADLLRAAIAGGRRSSSSSLLRGDMRHVPLRSSGVDVVLSIFTSIGYFDDPADEARVLSEVSRVLRPGGRFIADLINPSDLARSLVPASVRRMGDRRISERRRIRRGRVEKTITIESAVGGAVRRYRESVRLIDRGTLIAWARAAGLEPVQLFGDYDGQPFEDGRSPRIVALFTKEIR